jgi:FkbM family methyltransferase
MEPTLKHAALRIFGHQHYILRGRRRILLMIHNPETSPSIPFEVPFFGMRYPGNLNNFLDWNVYYFGAYAPQELFLLRDVAAALRKAKASPLTFYDIGANTGHHTLFMSPLVDTVIAFEPFAACRDKLHEKIERNHLGNVRVFPVGLGDRDAELDYFEPSGANFGSGSFMTGQNSSGGNVRKLPVCHGDSYFDANRLPALDLVKMDVEGYEIRVLRGLRQRIQRDRPVIVMEFSAETRADIGTEDNFRKLLYEDALIFKVGGISVSSSYRLRKFRFATSRELVVIPKEKLSLFKKIVS